MGRACCTHRQKRNVCKVLAVKPEGKRPRGIPRHRWEDSIKMDLQERGWGGKIKLSVCLTN
jgi:hypothetical protein